jgi:hypothetical protein
MWTLEEGVGELENCMESNIKESRPVVERYMRTLESDGESQINKRPRRAPKKK